MILGYTFLGYVGLVILLIMNGVSRGTRIADGLAKDQDFEYTRTLDDRVLFFVVEIVYVALALLFIDAMIVVIYE